MNLSGLLEERVFNGGNASNEVIDPSIRDLKFMSFLNSNQVSIFNLGHLINVQK